MADHSIVELGGLRSPQVVVFNRAFLQGDYRFQHDEGWLTEAKMPELDELIWSTPLKQMSQTSVGYLGTCLVRVALRQGTVNVELCATTEEELKRVATKLRALFPVVSHAPGPDVSMSFWCKDSEGDGVRYQRKIAAPPWADIRDNYNQGVRADLDKLMAATEPHGGQMIIWTGAPGTGKTYAIRALAQAWRPWVDFHYMIDPERFFGDASASLVQLLLSQDDDDLGYYDPSTGTEVENKESKSRYKLLILEDCGQMLSKDAKQNVGQGLSRLLNIADGMLGQGLRVLMLITANEDVGAMSDAITRPGRCWQQVKFAALSAEEQRAWYASHGAGDLEPRGGELLADMYGRVNEWSENRRPIPAGFGVR